MPLYFANGTVALPMVSHDANSFVLAEKLGDSFCGRGLGWGQLVTVIRKAIEWRHWAKR
jgi:hypothetical protein